MFHQTSIQQACCNGSLPKHLWTAICALGCRFSSHQSQRDLAPIFAETSRSILGQQLEHLSLENVQTCVLLANWYAAVQNNNLEAMYFGKSSVMARFTSTDSCQALLTAQHFS
jgi:hypothetical protein